MYRLLLLLYPRGFRRRYGAEMAQDFDRLLEQARTEHGLPGAVGLWLGTAKDTLVSGVGERLFGRTTEDDYVEGTMKGVIFELVQAFRGLRRAPGYTVAFVLTLGLAIGVNSAVFSVVNGVLLRPLPYQDAERILYLKQPVAATGVENMAFSFMEIDDYRVAASTIDEFVEFGDWEFTVLGEGQPHRAVGGLVTSNYFEVLGMRPARGRMLNEQDDARGSEPVMLMTDAYWERTFGRDLSVVGRVLRLENLNLDGGAPFTPTRVVGVLEPGLHSTGSRQQDFYVNYAANDHYQDASMRDARGHRMTHVFARLAPGATLSHARSELESIAGRMHEEYPETYEPQLGFGIEAVPWEHELTHEGRSTFLFLMGTVAIVLLLAAFNVANLMLTRLIRKEGELSTRAALGATVADLRIQLTVEQAVLGLGGGGLGILMAYASRDSLVSYAARFTVRAQEVGVDWTVLGATLGGGVLLSILLAWIPGLPIGSVDRVATARSMATDTRWRRQLQRGLVVSQLALSFTLLTGTGVMVRSMIALTSVDPGFQTDEILTVRTPVGPSGTPLPFGGEPGWAAALEEIRNYPGVRNAAVATWAPLGDVSPSALTVRIDDAVDPSDENHLSASNNVSPAYFEMLGIPLIAGRYFDESDREESADVVILNESMARAHFGAGEAIGRRIAFTPDFLHVFTPTTYEVVGVVADSREYGMQTEGIHTFYRPAVKTSWGPTVLVSHQGDGAALAEHVRDVIHRMQPDRAVEEIHTLEALLDRDTAPLRLNAILFGTFALLALLIAGVGVLATLAFSVSQRVREFGIRIALGADQQSLLGSVLGEGMLLVGIALVAGAGATTVLGRFLTRFLYLVDPSDLPSMLAAGAILGAVALGAAFVPALRATRIHPAEALKSE